MTLHRLLADYRKTLRRLRRRSSLASARQILAWKRRLEYLTGRLRLRGLVRVRHAAVAALLGLSVAAAATPMGNSFFTNTRDGLASMPMGYSGGDYNVAAFGDIDGDGDLDAAVLNDSGTYFLRNDGGLGKPNWTFVGYASNPFYYMPSGGSCSDCSGLALVDIDADGDLDLLHGDGPYFYENTGTPQNPVFTYRYGSQNPFTAGLYGPAYYANRPTFGDIDGDGDLDLFSGINYDNGVYFWRNDGTPQVPVFNYVFSYDPTHPWQVPGFDLDDFYDDSFPQFGDLDRDGDLDLLVFTYDSGVYAVYNDGTRTAPKFTRVVHIDNLYMDDGIGSAADVDRDGDVDLFMGNDEEYLLFAENVSTSGGARFNQPVPMGSMYLGGELGDIDGDGDIDFAGASFSIRNEDGAGRALKYSDNPLYGMNYVISGRSLGDLDGDGDLDAVSWSGYPYAYRNDGWNTYFTGLYGPGTPFDGASGASLYFPIYSQLVDVDGDRDLDLVFASASQYCDSYYPYTCTDMQAFYRNDGTRSAADFNLVTGSTNPFNNFVYEGFRPFVIDIDGDGDQDMVAFNMSNGYSHMALRNNGDGQAWTFVPPAENPVYGVTFDDPRYDIMSMMAVDLDKDGDLDFRYLNYDTYSWFTLKNNIPRFAKVDPVAAEAKKPVIGPVPAKQGDPLCLFVDKVTDDLSVEFFNVAGEKVLADTALAGNPCVRAEMAPGLYWAKVRSEGRISIQKIIITK